MFIPIHDGKDLVHISTQYVTLALIGLNIGIWAFFGTGLFMGAETVQAIVYAFGFIPVVATGQEVLPLELREIPTWASFVTYAFLHHDLMHLAGNMLFVWVFGDNVEDAMGHIRFLVFYLCCAAAGALVHMLAFPNSEVPLIGASGAAAGIITAYLMLHPRVRVWVLALGRIPLRLSAAVVLGIWIGFQIYSFLFSSGDRISWAAHVGGIAAGAALLPVFKRRGVALFDRRTEEIRKVPPTEQDLPNAPSVPARADGKEEETVQLPWGRQPRQDG